MSDGLQRLLPEQQLVLPRGNLSGGDLQPGLQLLDTVRELLFFWQVSNLISNSLTRFAS